MNARWQKILSITFAIARARRDESANLRQYGLTRDEAPTDILSFEAKPVSCLADPA
jgi:hypothetical protein